MHLFIALPCYSGFIWAGTVNSLIRETAAVVAQGIPVQCTYGLSDPIITRMRNVLCARFLASEATDLFFIDSDVAWSPGALLRLSQYPVDVVAGIYPERKDPISWPVRLFVNSPTIHPNGKLVKVDAAPTGFMRISRRALEMIAAEKPELHYQEPRAPEGKAVSFFDFVTEPNGTFWGEDFVFCHRWRSLGGDVWVDPDITFEHHGTKTYQGRFLDAFKPTEQPQAPKL